MSIEHLQSRLTALETETARLSHEVARFRQIVEASQGRAPNGMTTTKQEKESIARIKRTVAAHFGLNEKQIVSRIRTRVIAYPRQVACYLIRKREPRVSLNSIRDEFRPAMTDHGTVMHACSAVADLIATDPRARRDLDELEAKLGNGD